MIKLNLQISFNCIGNRHLQFKGGKVKHYSSNVKKGCNMRYFSLICNCTNGAFIPDLNTDSFEEIANKKDSKPIINPEEREQRIKELLSMDLWDIAQTAEYLNMTVASVRNMATREEIPGLKRLNGKKWRVHVATFIEWFKEPKKQVKANKNSTKGLRL